MIIRKKVERVLLMLAERGLENYPTDSKDWVDKSHLLMLHSDVEE